MFLDTCSDFSLIKMTFAPVSYSAYLSLIFDILWGSAAQRKKRLYFCTMGQWFHSFLLYSHPSVYYLKTISGLPETNVTRIVDVPAVNINYKWPLIK